MIELTTFRKQGGPLTKRISLAADGSLNSDGSACVMTIGTAHRLRLSSLEEFASFIQGMGEDSAIALGTLREDVQDPVQVVTAGRLPRAAARSIARTTEYLSFRPGQPALVLLDVDVKGLPPQTAELIDELGGFWAAITSVVPALAGAATLRRASTSAGLRRRNTGAPVSGSRGLHIYVLVQDGEDIPRFLRALHSRLWLAGLGWFTIGGAGQILDRSLIDRSVGSAERLVFESAPLLASSLVQDQVARAPEVIPGAAIDTRSVCPELSLAEKARLSDQQQKARARLSSEASAAQKRYVAERGDLIVKRVGCSPALATRIVERQLAGVLRPDIELHFDDPELSGLTVGDVLADPTRFVGETLADPLEGPAYGRGKAKILARVDGSLWINSFAHGRSTYDLQHDARSLLSTLQGVPSEDRVRAYVAAVTAADVNAQEQQRLDVLISKQEGVGLAPLRRMTKSEANSRRGERAREEKARRLAERTDRRPRLPVPKPDAERLPTLKAIDEILVSCDDQEPPMRDLDGHPVQIRNRASSTLHELTSAGANGTEEPGTRLPPPEYPLITRHDRYTLAHEIERHIEFFSDTENGDVSVAAPQVFIDHYTSYRDSRVPLVQAIATSPLVMRDGQILNKNGLHRALQLVLRIAPELKSHVPDPEDCTATAVAEALRFLLDEWLVDVHTSSDGKCVLIAMALSVIERILLPERPVFFVSAPRRGGGKTTALSMISTLVTGKRPAADAWSTNEEERRKAMLANLSEGLPLLAWDNIATGSVIKCPTLEKVLTSPLYADRSLGVTERKTVPTQTIMAMTGNNIRPAGDLASRTLLCRLDVDRVDPENRSFRHVDPIAWTAQHRGKLLRALYTILLGNPQLRAPVQPETRFKEWWNLVGSAIEHAAAELRKLAPETMPHPLKFSDLFATSEVDDDDAADLTDLLGFVRDWRGTAPFKASDLVLEINTQASLQDERSLTLRSYFEGQRRGDQNLTVKSVGRALMRIQGTPERVEGTTMRLVRVNKGDGKKAAVFQLMMLAGGFGGFGGFSQSNPPSETTNFAVSD